MPYAVAPFDLVRLVVTRVGQNHPLAVRLPHVCGRGVAKRVNIHVEGLGASFVELGVGLGLPRALSRRATGIHRPRLASRWQGLSRLRHGKRELVAVSEQEAAARALEPHGLHLLRGRALLVDLFVDIEVAEVLGELLALSVLRRDRLLSNLLGLDLVL